MFQKLQVRTAGKDSSRGPEVLLNDHGVLALTGSPGRLAHTKKGGLGGPLFDLSHNLSSTHHGRRRQP
jgi:hypothetical protein